MEARRYVVTALAGVSIVAVGAVAATALPGGGAPPVPEIVDVAAEPVAEEPLAGAEKAAAFEMTPKQQVSALQARDGWEHLLAEPIVEKPAEKLVEPEPMPEAKKPEPEPKKAAPKTTAPKKPAPKTTDPKTEPKKLEPEPAPKETDPKTEPKTEPKKPEPSSTLWPEGVHTHVVSCTSDGAGTVNVDWEAKLWGGTWDVVGTSGNVTGTERLHEDKALVRFSDSGVPPSEQYAHKARVTGSVTLAQRDDPTVTKAFDVEAWSHLEACS